MVIQWTVRDIWIGGVNPEISARVWVENNISKIVRCFNDEVPENFIDEVLSESKPEGDR
jgi:hypothetical protein